MSEFNANILLVEDHRPLAETVIDFLEAGGFQIDYADNGSLGFQLAASQDFDAIILDVMLPGMDGFEICRKVRKGLAKDTPIIMLTARDQLNDKLQGFDEGADDYLLKPFDLAELEARLNALIKRSRGEVSEQVLQVADLVLDTGNKSVKRGGTELKLSSTLFKILKILLRESPKVVSKETIERELWGDFAPDSDTLRSHLYKLRKMVDKPFDKALIHTISGVGVKIEETVD